MTNTKYFQKKLEEERIALEDQLKELGRINPQNPDDWEPTPEKGDTTNQDPDKNVVADAVEDFESRSAVEVVLENRLRLANDALERIEDGTYGVCKVCGKDIEEERLEANPAANTCKAHVDIEL